MRRPSTLAGVPSSGYDVPRRDRPVVAGKLRVVGCHAIDGEQNYTGRGWNVELERSDRTRVWTHSHKAILIGTELELAPLGSRVQDSRGSLGTVAGHYNHFGKQGLWVEWDEPRFGERHSRVGMAAVEVIGHELVDEVTP